MLNSVYEVLPVSLQNAAISLFGWKLKLQRYGVEYRRHKQWLRHTDSLPRSELKRIQDAELRKFLTLVHEQSPFYRELWAGVDMSSIQTTEDLSRIAVLTKDDLRRQMSRIRCGRGRLDIHVHTGGTTGTPLEVVFDRTDMERRMAMLDFHREKWGFRNGMARATFSGRTVVSRGSSVFWRHNGAMNQRLYSTFHLANDNLSKYVEDLQRFQPAMIDGFPTAIARVANWMAERGIRLHDPPKLVSTTSETLYEVQRESIAKAFGCLVSNQYASAEGAPFIVQCPAGGMHYDLRSGVIEVQDNGEILITSFTTKRTPLVRYAIGDRVELLSGDGTCSCGSGAPLVRSVLGRGQEYLVSRERGPVAVGLVDIFKKTPSVFLRSQILQRELDVVELLLVATGTDGGQEYYPVLEAEIKKRMGDAVRVDFKVVSDIPCEANGKYLYIKNLLPSAIREEARRQT